MGGRIIVADDSVTIQKVVELTLGRENVELIQARSGEETVRKAQEAKPDLMLIDHSMPDRSGPELCAVLRQNALLKDVPIILMAGASQPVDEVEVRRAGATDVVTKPFDSETLIEKVRQLLLAPSPPAAVPEPSLAPPPEGVVLEAEKLPEEVPSVLEAPKPSGETLLTYDITEPGLEEPPLEVGVPEPSGGPIPTYDVPLTEGQEVPLEEMVQEVMQSSPSPEVQERGTEEMAAAVGIEAPAAETVEERAVEPVQGPQEVQVAEVVPAGPQPLTVPPELVETLAREVAERVATHTVRELKTELLDRVEQILWEVVPELAEQLITQEIQRIRDLVEGKK